MHAEWVDSLAAEDSEIGAGGLAARLERPLVQRVSADANDAANAEGARQHGGVLRMRTKTKFSSHLTCDFDK
jgi:hypothetical protein